MRVIKDGKVYSSQIMFLILPSGKRSKSAQLKNWRKDKESNEKPNTVSIFHTINIFHTMTVRNVNI